MHEADVEATCARLWSRKGNSHILRGIFQVIVWIKDTFIRENSIFLRLTVELAGNYALIGIFCLIRYVRWYVGYVIS